MRLADRFRRSATRRSGWAFRVGKRGPALSALVQCRRWWTTDFWKGPATTFATQFSITALCRRAEPERSRVLRAGLFVYATDPGCLKFFRTFLEANVGANQSVFLRYQWRSPPLSRRRVSVDRPFNNDRGGGAHAFCAREPPVQTGCWRSPPLQSDPGIDPAAGMGAAFLRLQTFPNTLAVRPWSDRGVCQYERNTSTARLQSSASGFPNVWLVGGGSGHGFKHRPMVGEYLILLISGTESAEPRFSLAPAKGRRPQPPGVLEPIAETVRD